MALRPDGLERQFWGFGETRPFMRARHGLAITLLRLGEEDAALDHVRDLLRLNPNDNQGIRYLLLAELMRRNAIPELKALLASQPDEWSANWPHTRALIAFRERLGGRPAILKLLLEARKRTSTCTPSSPARC